MSLIKCKECGKEISKNAKSCPHCGEKIEKNNLFLEIIGTIFILWIIVVSNESTSEDSTELDLMAECQNKIQYSLRYPESFECGFGCTTTQKVGNEFWVEVKFKAKNGFGGEIPTKGNCVFENGKLTYFKIQE